MKLISIRRLTVVLVAVVVASAGLCASGCGSPKSDTASSPSPAQPSETPSSPSPSPTVDSAVGAYEWKSGDETIRGMTIELAEDGTMTVRGTVLDQEMSSDGEWTQDGSKVTVEFTALEEKQTQEGEYKDGEIDFGDVVWVWVRE